MVVANALASAEEIVPTICSGFKFVKLATELITLSGTILLTTLLIEAAAPPPTAPVNAAFPISPPFNAASVADVAAPIVAPAIPVATAPLIAPAVAEVILVARDAAAEAPTPDAANTATPTN